ncbi:MAG: arginine--tRNA ligase [Armatimonadetes bacterium]|nr:arginine--tRNA ligase [Armatimonadota bacterium]
MLKERLYRAVKDALAICRAEDLVPDVGVPVEIVAQAGAYATDVPLLLARRSENTSGTTAARAATYAESLAENINAHDAAPCVATISDTGTLFLRPTPAAYAGAVRATVEAGESFGTNTAGANRRALVEFVSANPHTPISLHHARGAAVGDALSHLLTASGYEVEREFYVNDGASASGLRSLSRAVFAAYREHFGVETGESDADFYTGEYVRELAEKIAESSGNRYVDLSPEAAATAITPAVLSLMQDGQREILARLGVSFDRWFSESALLAEGALQNVMDALLASGAAYAHGGALWLRTTAFGDDSDRVLLRNDGTPSYFAGDLAYHADKLQARAYGLAVDVWNADHEPYIGRTLAGLAALGVADVPSRLKIAVYGTVRPVQDGTQLRGGRYAGGMVSLREVLDAGADTDALRFALLLAAPTPSPTDLNVDTLAPNAPGNALASVRAAIAQGTGDVQIVETIDRDDLCAVIRQVEAFAETVTVAVATVSPGEVARWAWSLAGAVNRLPDDNAPETAAATRAAGVVLTNALRLLGIVSA